MRIHVALVILFVLLLLHEYVLISKSFALLSNVNYDSVKTNVKLLAFQDSNGFFDDIPDSMWLKSKEKVQRRITYFDKRNPEAGHDNPQRWYAHNTLPYLSCPNVVRVGGKADTGLGDGPKWICDPYRTVERVNQRMKSKSMILNHQSKNTKSCLIYSFGSNGKFDFEEALSQRFNKSCEIHVFDPTNFTRQNDVESFNIHFHPYGLLSSYSSPECNPRMTVFQRNQRGEMTFKTMQDIQKELGHIGQAIEYLKIDCEGCEW